VITRQPLSLAIEGRNDAARSFAELDSCAKLLAAHLRTEDSAETGRVAICLTCVPLDPSSSAAWLAGKIAALDANIVLCDSIATPSFASLTRKLIILDQKCDVITATSSGEIPPIAKTQPAFCVVGTEFDEAPAVRTLSSELLLEACPLVTTGGTACLRGNSAFGNARRGQHHSAGRGRTRRDTKKCEAYTSASDVCAMAQLDNRIREKGPVFTARFAIVVHRAERCGTCHLSTVAGGQPRPGQNDLLFQPGAIFRFKRQL
jgi:hypothetical protein